MANTAALPHKVTRDGDRTEWLTSSRNVASGCQATRPSILAQRLVIVQEWPCEMRLDRRPMLDLRSVSFVAVWDTVPRCVHFGVTELLWNQKYALKPATTKQQQEKPTQRVRRKRLLQIAHVFARSLVRHSSQSNVIVLCRFTTFNLGLLFYLHCFIVALM